MQSKTLIIATAGHVDHGKSSLVKRLTGVDTDTLNEEKQRGLTINLGYAYHHFEGAADDGSQKYTLGFVDVPGHIDFINNMLAGVSAVDFALLVIAADDGVMPQTKEHLSIIELLGIQQGAIALTKTDRVDENRVEEVQKELGVLLKDSSFTNAPIFPLANTTGTGIDTLKEHLKSVVINHSGKDSSNDNKSFRFLIDRTFTVKGIGTLVTGIARAGYAESNAQLITSNNGAAARIRAMRLDTNSIECINTGERAAIHIDTKLDYVKRGDWLIEPRIHHPITRFDASIKVLDPANTLRPSAEYHLFLGASHHIATLRYLGSKEDLLVQVKSSDPVIAHYGDRFIIRDPASQHTLGGGMVIDTFVPRRRRSSEHRLKLLNVLQNDNELALQSLVELSPEGVNLEQFSINRNLKRAKLDAIINDLQNRNLELTQLKLKTKEENILLHKNFFDKYANQILSKIKEFHKSNPSQQGISEPILSRAIIFSGSHFLFHALLQRLVDSKSVMRTGTLLHIPDHQTSLSKEEEEFLAKIRPLLIKAGNVSPRTRELVELTGIPLKPLEKILNQTTKVGSLIRVADNRYYLPETIMTLAGFTEQLVDDQSNNESFSVIQFRDASGIGRNLCIEILEYFDRVGFTRRDGNARFLRTDKENIFGA